MMNVYEINNILNTLPIIGRHIQIVGNALMKIPEQKPSLPAGHIEFINEVVIPVTSYCATKSFEVIYSASHFSVKMLTETSRSLFISSEGQSQNMRFSCGLRITPTENASTPSPSVRNYNIEVEFNGSVINLCRDYSTDEGSWPAKIVVAADQIIPNIEKFKQYLDTYATSSFVNECYSIMPSDDMVREIREQFGDNIQIFTV